MYSVDFMYEVWLHFIISPLDCSKHFTLPTGRHVRSDINSTSLGSIQLCCNYNEDHTFTFPPPSIARYSFIQLSEMGRRGENENAKTVAKGIRTRAVLIASLAF